MSSLKSIAILIPGQLHSPKYEPMEDQITDICMLALNSKLGHCFSLTDEFVLH